jgi:hypothetical protein
VAGSVTFLAAALLGILAKRIPIQVAVLACGMAPVLAGIGILMSQSRGSRGES